MRMPNLSQGCILANPCSSMYCCRRHASFPYTHALMRASLMADERFMSSPFDTDQAGHRRRSNGPRRAHYGFA